MSGITCGITRWSDFIYYHSTASRQHIKNERKEEKGKKIASCILRFSVRDVSNLCINQSTNKEKYTVWLELHLRGWTMWWGSSRISYSHQLQATRDQTAVTSLMCFPRGSDLKKKNRRKWTRPTSWRSNYENAVPIWHVRHPNKPFSAPYPSSPYPE